jgi:hypothetical protein
MKNTLFIPLLLLALLPAVQLHGQGNDMYGKGIRLNVNDDGTKYIRFITWHQVWGRYVQNNPGSMVNGLPEQETFDVGIRRSRFLWYTQISQRALILMHIGINNQTFATGGVPGGGLGGNSAATVPDATSAKKPQVFIHDAWTEYMIFKDKLNVGAGLHYWGGISRITSASTLNFMALDAPIFNWPTIELQDQFVREFGYYAKGKIGRFDYRVSINKPFATPVSNTVTFHTQNNGPTGTTGLNTAQNYNNNSWGTKGYIAYEFFDKESNLLPFFVGTHLGSKKVFNLGFGWQHHPDAMATRDTVTRTGLKRHDMALFGVDAFLDLPINKEAGTALTIYTVYYNYNFGPNYIRTIGLMNVGTNAPAGIGAGTPLRQGAGNNQWHIGTGSIVYGEIGYLLPKSLATEKARIQPFASGIYKQFEALGDPSFQYGVGTNVYLDGHHSKITLKYQRRPLYRDLDNNAATKLQLDGQLGEFIIQTMIYL